MKTKFLLIARPVIFCAALIFICLAYQAPASAIIPIDNGGNSGSSNTGSDSNCFGGTSDANQACVQTCPTDPTTKQPTDCTNDPVFVNCKLNSDNQVGKNDTKALGDCLAKNNLVTTYLNPFIKLLSFVVGLAVTIGIIVGGIQYAGSGGDPQKAALGKKHIRNALIALAVYALLFAILQFLVPGGVLS